MSSCDISRRKLLAVMSSVSTLTVAGCGIPDGLEQSAPTLRVRNFLNQSATVSLAVRNTESGEVVVDDTVSLEPNESQPYDQSFATGEKKVLTASVDGGPTNEYSWGASDERRVSFVELIIEEDGDMYLSISIQ